MWVHAFIGTASRACTQPRVEAHKHAQHRVHREDREQRVSGRGEESPQSVFQVSISQFFSPRWALTENYSISVSICPQTLIKNLLSVWYGAKWGPTRGQPSDNEGTTKAASCGNKWLVKSERKDSLEQLVKMEKGGNCFIWQILSSIYLYLKAKL